MKPSSAKAKGRKFQQEVRDKILTVFKSLALRDVQSTSMGAGGEDIKLSSEAHRLFPFSVECKHRKTFAIYNDYEQAVSNAPKGATPIVFLKANRKAPLVLLDADDFMKIISRK